LLFQLKGRQKPLRPLRPCPPRPQGQEATPGSGLGCRQRELALGHRLGDRGEIRHRHLPQRKVPTTPRQTLKQDLAQGPDAVLRSARNSGRSSQADQEAWNYSSVSLKKILFKILIRTILIGTFS
jgi:hypothetical protein